MNWITWCLVSACFGGLFQLFLKMASGGTSALLVGLAICIVEGVFFASLWFMRGGMVNPASAYWSIAAGICGALGLMTALKAFQSSKGMLVTPLLSLNIVIATMLYAVFLSERITPTQIIAICLALLSVVLISL